MVLCRALIYRAVKRHWEETSTCDAGPGNEFSFSVVAKARCYANQKQQRIVRKFWFNLVENCGKNLQDNLLTFCKINEI